MVERTIDERIRVVLLYIDGHTVAEEICAMHGIPLRTFRRWVSAYRNGGIEALKSKKRGPKSGTNSIRAKLELRIIELKQKTSFLWCAADQVSVRPALLLGYCSQSDKTPSDAHHDQTNASAIQAIPAKACGVSVAGRLARSSSAFRAWGKVYVTGFTDDRSRFRIASGVYLRKGANEAIDALRFALAKKWIPREIYLDNAKQFIAKEFKGRSKETGNQTDIRQTISSKRKNQDRELP